MTTTPIIQVQGKTEQRIASVVKVLREKAPGSMTYEDLIAKTSSSYDVLLYILQTLVVVGMVEREDVVEGPGRPKCYFRWTGAQELGS